MRPMIWLGGIAVVIIACITPALTETLTCSTWQGVRTCQDAHGYVSHETEWQGRANGWDNRGDTWSTSGLDLSTYGLGGRPRASPDVNMHWTRTEISLRPTPSSDMASFFVRSRGRNRASHRRSPAPESARSGGFRLDELRRHVEECPRQL
jgi:hypothetical protein